LGIASDALQYNRKYSKYQLKVVKESIRKNIWVQCSTAS